MPRPSPFSENEIQFMIDLYEQGYGPSDIIAQLGLTCKPHQVSYAVSSRRGYLRPKGHLVNVQPISLEAVAFLDGHLLGDGHITRPHDGCNARFGLHLASRFHDFALWAGDVLADCGIKSYNHCRSTSVFYTAARAALTDMRQRWYPDGHKEIPKDLVLSPNGLAAWYLGDGSLIRRPRGVAVRFYTNSFSFAEVEYLQGCLFDTFNIKTTIHRHRPGTSGWATNPFRAVPVLYIPQQEAPLLFEIMGSCPVLSLRHKWP